MADRRRKPRDTAARRQQMGRIAEVLQQGEPSRFRFEGACRHAVRARLCLEGWPYHAADAEAHQLVQGALDMIAARRPSWEMGQPEYVHQHLDLTTRARCARCFRRLPDERPKYCSDVCHASASADRRTVDQRERNRAMKQAQRAASPKQRTQP